jgi:DNA polymerase-3 subunit epsilon
MRRRLKFAAWLAALYGAALAVAAAALLFLVAGMPAEEQAVFANMLAERAALLAFLAAALLAACGGVVAWFFRRFVTAPRALAEQTRLVLVNPGYRVAAASAELGPLDAEINRLAGAYHAAQTDTEAKIAESRARLEEERNRLAASCSTTSRRGRCSTRRRSAWDARCSACSTGRRSRMRSTSCTTRSTAASRRPARASLRRSARAGCCG